MRVILLFFIFCFAYAEEKLNIAVTNLDGRDLVEGEAKTLTDALSNYLINTNTFRVMERGKMDMVLKEQGFQASGACTDEACLVEMGQLLGVEFMITGSVGKVGGTYSVSIRMINISTGEITRTANKFYKGEIDGLLTETIPAIANEFAGTKQTQLPIQKEEVKRSYTMIFIGVGVVIVGGVVAFLLLNKKSPPPPAPAS